VPSRLRSVGLAPNTLTFHFDRLRQAGLAIIAQLSGMLAAIVLGRWLWRKDA
jgi:hypothetical protein